MPSEFVSYFLGQSKSDTLPNDVLYTILMIVSVASGLLVRLAPPGFPRRLVCSAVGVGLLGFACRWETLHPLIVTVGNCFLITVIGSRWCHMASFIWCFGYLAFFRAAHWFGLPTPHPVTNAVQLFNALRMIGVAFEVHDSVHLKKRDKEDEEEARLKKEFIIKPSPLDIINYSLCHVGLFTGPYYKYRTYHDMLHLASDANIPIRKNVMARLKQIPLIAVMYLATSTFFSLEYVNSDPFLEDPFWFRLFYMTPIFMIFRSRLYLAWIMSEMMSFTSGLGAYPVDAKPQVGEGPTDLKAMKECEGKDIKMLEYDFETIHNINIWGCELAATSKEGMRSWNMSVQYWLAAYVFRRVRRSYGYGRNAITMSVSAFWHGIHPGYYLSFLTVPPIIVAEDLMTNAFRRGSATQRHLFDWACWFFKMRGFDYNCMGFVLLTYYNTVRYWKSIYFTAHVFIVLFIGIGLLFAPKKKREEKTEKKE